MVWWPGYRQSADAVTVRPALFGRAFVATVLGAVAILFIGAAGREAAGGNVGGCVQILSTRAPIFGLGPGGTELVPVGRFRRMSRAERRRMYAERGVSWPGRVPFVVRGQFAAIEVTSPPMLVPLAALWGGYTSFRASLGGLVVVAADGRAFLSAAVPGGFWYPRSRRRFLRLLRDLEALRTARTQPLDA